MNFDDEKLVKIASRILTHHRTRKISTSTRNRYLQAGEQLFAQPRKLAQTTRKATYYFWKAALNFYGAEQLIDAIKNKDLIRVRHVISVLQATLCINDTDEISTIAGTCPITTIGVKKSKRGSLSKLPENWRELFIAGTSGIHRDWLLVLSAAGVRPAEIANGIEIEPHSNGVILKILGAKTTATTGQPIREIQVANEFGSELAEGGKRVINAKNGNAVSQYICRRSRLIFPNHPNKISAYSFRHQFAADLKASQLTSLQISAALGHTAEFTKQHYGHKSQSRARGKILLKSATRPVRPSQKAGHIPGRNKGKRLGL